MISEEKFCNILNKMHEDDIAAGEINKILRKRKADDFANAFAIFEHNTMTIIDLLQECMNDTCGWIEWWVYETDYGNHPLEIFTDETKENFIYIHNPHELYHFLLEEFHNE